MKQPDLIRFAYLPDVTLGRWRLGSESFCTLEEPWRLDPDGPGGQRREGVLHESCIPDGTYELMPHAGMHWQGVWRFEAPSLGVYGHQAEIPAGAPYGRCDVLCHSGVDVGSILGCVLIGMTHKFDAGRWTVTDSRAALERMREILVVGTRHSVTIRPSDGTQEVW